MRVSVKKLLHDTLFLVDKHPEPYTYAVLVEALTAVRESAYEAAPEIRVVHIVDPGAELLGGLERGDLITDVRRRFIILFQSIWNQVNNAAKTLPKNKRKDFLRKTTALFWNTIAEEDKKAQSHSEGRRYGAFWIPFMVGATAIGSIFAYSSGKSTTEYIEEKEKKMSPIVYAGVGAAAVIGLSLLMRK